MTYWADDHSLWNPNLITPDPLMQNPAASSFAITYLEDNSREPQYAEEEEEEQVSDDSQKSMLDILPQTGMGLGISSVDPTIQVDDDVFF